MREEQNKNKKFQAALFSKFASNTKMKIVVRNKIDWKKEERDLFDRTRKEIKILRWSQF